MHSPANPPDAIFLKGWEVIAAFAAFFAVAVGCLILYLLLAPPPDGDLSQISVAMVMGIQGVAFAAGTAPLFIRHRSNAFRAVGLVPASARSFAICGLVTVAISFALHQALFSIWHLWGDPSDPLLAKQATEVGLAQSGLAGMLLAMAILTPLGEELFFRGVLFGWLRNRMRLRWAVLLQAILFGIFHVQLFHVLLATGIGASLALARERSRSLWPAISAHTLNNAIAVITAYVRLDGSASG